jgi:FKBP-type peptidyl-prolyl cis-trans isomerase
MIRKSMAGVALLGIGFLVTPVRAEEPTVLKTQKERVSYALGADLGNQLRKQSVDVDPALFSKGLQDALSGSKTLLSDTEVFAAIVELQAGLRQKAAETNKKAGEAFREENKKKDGVVTLPSGLQYKILKAGDGKKPAEGDTVICQYRGTLPDGTEFDSTYTRGQPATLPVKGLVKGWSEALQLMPVGSKWQIVVPPELGYGPQGAGKIGPNSTLVFEIELISIQDRTRAAAQRPALRAPCVPLVSARRRHVPRTSPVRPAAPRCGGTG